MGDGVTMNYKWLWVRHCGFAGNKMRGKTNKIFR